MYYRGSAAAVIVYDITKLVRITTHLNYSHQESESNLSLLANVHKPVDKPPYENVITNLFASPTKCGTIGAAAVFSNSLFMKCVKQKKLVFLKLTSLWVASLQWPTHVILSWCVHGNWSEKRNVYSHKAPSWVARDVLLFRTLSRPWRGGWRSWKNTAQRTSL